MQVTLPDRWSSSRDSTTKMSRPGLWNSVRVRRLQSRLLGWYARHRRVLPWREAPTPYRVWISEIMLQQTQVRTVLPYFERFMKRFPDIRSLAAAPESAVEEQWAGLGYYARARNIRMAAKIITAEYGGRFPDSFERLSSLPGIGRYTAGAILSIAFNQSLPVVDGNVRRVICRLDGIRGRPAESLLWERAAAWIPKGRASDFNQAVMELGALICTPSDPKCPVCPARILCEAERLGAQRTIPASLPRPETEKITLAALLFERRGHILLSSDKALPFIPGKWGLPAVRVAGSASAGEAAQELAHRLAGRTVGLAGPLRVRHSITHHRICAEIFRADCADARLEARSGYRWTTRADALRLITSSLFRKAIRQT